MLLFVPCVGWADEYTDPETGVTYTYQVTDGEVTITQISNAKGELSIPATLGGYPVTILENSLFDVIFQPIFNDCQITSLSIPASVKTIGQAAIEYQTSLTSISFAEDSQLENIKDFAFFEAGIKEITIPASVKNISEAAFNSCNKLETVTFLSDNLANPQQSSKIFCDYSGKITVDLKVIYVPKGTKEAFSTLFSEYPEIVSLIQETENTPAGIHATSTTPSAIKNAAIYTLDGKLASKDGSTAGLAKGVYIKNGKKVVISK